MANEQHRAQRIQTEFQKLLAELKKQDEEVHALCEAVGADPDSFSVVDVADHLPPAEAARSQQEAHRCAISLFGVVLRG